MGFRSTHLASRTLVALVAIAALAVAALAAAAPARAASSSLVEVEPVLPADAGAPAGSAWNVAREAIALGVSPDAGAVELPFGSAVVTWQSDGYAGVRIRMDAAHGGVPAGAVLRLMFRVAPARPAEPEPEPDDPADEPGDVHSGPADTPPDETPAPKPWKKRSGDDDEVSKDDGEPAAGDDAPAREHDTADGEKSESASKKPQKRTDAAKRGGDRKPAAAKKQRTKRGPERTSARLGHTRDLDALLATAPPSKPSIRPLPERRPDPRITHGGHVFPVLGPVSFGDTFMAGRISTGWHHGEDVFAERGAPVVAVADGKLFNVGWNPIGGWRLWLRDDAGNEFYYAHLSAYSPLAKNGARVRAGDVIGFVGTTGDAVGTPPHLHFEVHPADLVEYGYDASAVRPYPYLRAWYELRDISLRVKKPVSRPDAATPEVARGSVTRDRVERAAAPTQVETLGTELPAAGGAGTSDHRVAGVTTTLVHPQTRDASRARPAALALAERAPALPAPRTSAESFARARIGHRAARGRSVAQPVRERAPPRRQT
jgi:murein DD-endopeptidase MepM/ murein hydrolase activator NlpD